MGPVAIPAEDVGNSHGTATICGVYHWFIMVYHGFSSSFPIKTYQLLGDTQVPTK
jgi:hypothetical protein